MECRLPIPGALQLLRELLCCPNPKLSLVCSCREAVSWSRVRTRS